jgi:hypothetical protein
MYSVTELSKIFKTTRKTIYRKLETPSIQKYIEQTPNGKKLIQEGFNEFQLLMSTSKVNTSTTQDDTKEPMYTKEHVEDLKSQINELKDDKNRLYEEIQIKNDLLEKTLQALDNNQKLLKSSQEQLLLNESKESKKNSKKNWWPF